MVSHTRWVPIGFLFAGGMINYMDRSALSVAAPMVMKDLGLDAAQLGIIFSSFFAGYTLFTFIGGYAADILGPKRVFALAMTVWSTFCGLTAARGRLHIFTDPAYNLRLWRRSFRRCRQ